MVWSQSRISGPIIKTHMAYFLTDDSTPKGKDPNINIIELHSQDQSQDIC